MATAAFINPFDMLSAISKPLMVSCSELRRTVRKGYLHGLLSLILVLSYNSSVDDTQYMCHSLDLCVGKHEKKELYTRCADTDADFL